jgi:hypothetical protein
MQFPSKTQFYVWLGNPLMSNDFMFSSREFRMLPIEVAQIIARAISNIQHQEKDTTRANFEADRIKFDVDRIMSDVDRLMSFVGLPSVADGPARARQSSFATPAPITMCTRVG